MAESSQSDRARLTGTTKATNRRNVWPMRERERERERERDLSTYPEEDEE